MGLVIGNPPGTFFGDLNSRLMIFSAALDSLDGSSLRLAVSSTVSSKRGRAERLNALRLTFDIEAKVPLNGLYTPTPLTFPPEIAPALAPGALEIRARYGFRWITATLSVSRYSSFRPARHIRCRLCRPSPIRPVWPTSRSKSTICRR